jgi:hypothetical protein
LVDDYEAASAAAKAGLSGIMLKCHHESTVSRARATASRIDNVEVFGGIVLNEHVGGINPAAVEAALRLGAKEIWMPTIDAENHAKAHGSKGKYDVQDGRKDDKQDLSGVTIYNQDGNINEETMTVLDLIAEHNVILGTCHLGKSEILDLVAAAKKVGVRKILITHPYFKVPGFSKAEIKELVGDGVMAEFGYCTVSPMWHYATVQEVAATIQEIGAENAIIISDAGQRHNPMPHESLRVFAQCLHEAGLDLGQMDYLMKKNPEYLVKG